MNLLTPKDHHIAGVEGLKVTTVALGLVCRLGRRRRGRQTKNGPIFSTTYQLGNNLLQTGLPPCWEGRWVGERGTYGRAGYGPG